MRPEMWRRADVSWALPVRAPASAYYGGRAGMVLGEPADRHVEVHIANMNLPNVRDAEEFRREMRRVGDDYSSERSRGVARTLPAVR